MVFGYFTNGKVSEQEFERRIAEAFDSLGKDYDAEVSSFNFRLDWIEPVTLEGIRYGW